MPEIFEPNPRWPGGPKICVYENLPAFETEKELFAFNASCGGSSIMLKWQCAQCGCYHYHAAPPAPSAELRCGHIT